MKVLTFLVSLISSFILLVCSTPAYSNGWPNWVPDSAVVPFFFTSDSMGNTVGVAGVATGILQPQMSLLVMGLYSDKDTYVTYGALANYQAPGNWLLGIELYNGKFVDYDYYLGDQGNNNSSSLDVTETTGIEEKYRFSFRYILPWGEGENLGVAAGYTPNREVKGSNPFTSGVSSFEIQPFFASRELSTNDQSAEETWGVKLEFDWNNQNDNRNPTEGSRTQIEVTYSPEYKDDSQWAIVALHNSQYWDIGPLNDFFNKQVLAFSVYTADTPTWNNCSNNQCQRPPEYESVKLGGLFRLRSFTAGRFHGRSAISYTVEYRVMPEWQPLGSWPVFSLYNVPWWQWVAFTDVGRVADEYNLKTLHEDMKWSAGGAIRFQVEGVVVRTEVAWGSEDSIFRVMVNQPF
ncbi:BamA/TamA family outer membrane protein [Vibrio sp. VB16]|uniref:BamA/TamA family outer membrane protein n=1 Tax=Vibrio sp. VB16 TaxID=2785746 RepID=UPI00189FDAD5|nr:BamA/TamA family outer membrane protein [Vibrio sp. VB16]UGA54557.1 BamA/TamA family outer membrane protein [Vibrio sp. VB16]